MEEHLRELLSTTRGVLLDSSALLALHSEKYRRVLPVILRKTKAYVTMPTLVEVLTFMYYKQRVQDCHVILDALVKLYTLIPLDSRLAVRAAQLYADLLRHNCVPAFVDVVNVAAALEENLVLVSAVTSNYKHYERYDLIAIDLEEFITALERILEKG